MNRRVFKGEIVMFRRRNKYALMPRGEINVTRNFFFIRQAYRARLNENERYLHVLGRENENHQRYCTPAC